MLLPQKSQPDAPQLIPLPSLSTWSRNCYCYDACAEDSSSLDATVVVVAVSDVVGGQSGAARRVTAPWRDCVSQALVALSGSSIVVTFFKSCFKVDHYYSAWLSAHPANSHHEIAFLKPIQN